MKVTLLCENVSSGKCWLAEWGFSAFVQTDDVNILFDTGYSDVFKRNAEQAKINLDDADFVVLSHYHDDHTGGLQFHKFAEKKKIILHPRILQKTPSDRAKNILTNFEVIETITPLEFAPDIFYLGEIPRKLAFEKGVYKGDPMPDDSAIAIKTDNGAVVITGCSHAGICNICEHAKLVTGQKLYAALGGFHLLGDQPEVTGKTIEYFKQEACEKLFPMHCVDFPNMAQFHAQLGCMKYSAGDTIEL
jgi:7,8-dihydropterin-6-yl-methyl-4-(beta-D-ribofuranosyl)aminobenzene 5'-phosphate synthase